VNYTVKLHVNGNDADVIVEARETLLDVLRHHLGLTGAHAGCEHGACGACTVLLDGAPVRSCIVLAVQCAEKSVTTIESFGTPDALHPVMDAFRRHHGLQCGFCTPAMVLSAIALLDEQPHPTDHDIRTALAGNLCRCTGYSGIVAAVLDAAGSTVDAGS
jgi:aerobic-type carbon monoxide dehydrogenase small subunit (CoxS/CutS family)